MPNYRLYRLDGAGKIANAEWIEASRDEDALQEAQTRAQAGSYELWQGSPGAAAPRQRRDVTAN